MRGTLRDSTQAGVQLTQDIEGEYPGGGLACVVHRGGMPMWGCRLHRTQRVSTQVGVQLTKDIEGEYPGGAEGKQPT